MGLSEIDAVVAAKEVFSKNPSLKAIKKRFRDWLECRVNETGKDDFSRVGIYLTASLEIREKIGPVSRACSDVETPLIAYCDISHETGVCSEVVVLHSLDEIELLSKKMDEDVWHDHCVHREERSQRLSLPAALKAVRRACSNDPGVIAIKERIGDRLSLWAQMAGDKDICRVKIDLSPTKEIGEKCGGITVAGAELTQPCIGYCDISVKTGICSEIVVLFSLDEIEKLAKEFDEAYIQHYGL